MLPLHQSGCTCLPADSLPSPLSSVPVLGFYTVTATVTCPGTQKRLSWVNTPLSVMPQIAAPSVVSSCPALLYCHGYSHWTCPGTMTTVIASVTDFSHNLSLCCRGLYRMDHNVLPRTDLQLYDGSNYAMGRSFFKCLLLYYCYCRSTEPIRLSISSVDIRMYGNWSALTKAELRKLVLPHPIFWFTFSSVLII